MVNVFQQAFDVVTRPDARPIPTSIIEGSSAGSPSPENEARANALFPFVDGDTVTLPANPRSQDGTIEYVIGTPNTPAPGLASEEFVEDFLSWHSAHQLQYIHEFGDDVGTGKAITFGSGLNRLDVAISDSGQEVLLLQFLSKGEFGALNRADQLIVSGILSSTTIRSPFTAAEQNALTTILGAEHAPSGSPLRNAVNLLISNAINNIENDQFELTNSAFSDLSADARSAFADQLRNIRSRADGLEFLALAEIQAKVEAITARADRADEFFKTAQHDLDPLTDPLDPPNLSFLDDNDVPVNSLDLNQTIIRGVRNFISQEMRIRDFDTQRLQMSRREGVFASARNVDVPTLIANLQLNYNLGKEAEAAAETEEVQQQNALLRDYSVMQDIINRVLQAFNTGEDAADEERDIAGRLIGSEGRRFNSDDLGDVENQHELLVLATVMFDDGFGGNSGGHPIENLRNILRPDNDLIDFVPGVLTQGTPGRLVTTPIVNSLNRFSQNAWNIYGTRLADAVTQINQQSQILTNEISSLNRERNRHFDLANNALRRLNDSLQTIARI